MTTQNTDTQLKYITVNGQLDTSFALSVRKAQASKYAKVVLKRALRASIAATGQGITELSKCIELNMYDNKHGTHLRHEYALLKQAKRDAAMRERYMPVERTERGRNSQGMFIAA
jgi:hypothetical protein